MHKAHEEGGDLTSSERLAAAFLTLGIADISDDEAETEPVDENEPATYRAALRSPQAREWKEVMRQEWQVLVENLTVDIVGKGNTFQQPIANVAVEEPIGCKWIYKRKVNPDGSTLYKA
jgi:hypothetical protein